MYCKNYKILDLFDKGSEGIIYLFEKNKKKYLGKTPIKKKEEEISLIMSEKVGPKIYDFINCNIENINGKTMIMEKLEGIDLFRYLDENDNIFIENENDIIVKKLVEKIKTMHKLDYCHNDLYTPNIFLILKDNKIIDVKIIDFGKSTKKTNDLMYNDYKMLINYIYENHSYITDKIEPLLYTLEQQMEEL